MSTARLPHDHPFRLVDRAEGASGPGRARMVRCVSADDALAPGQSTAALSLLLESCAQAAGCAAATAPDAAAPTGGAGRLAAVERFRVRHGARPGDRLVIEASVERRLGALCRCACRVACEKRTVAEGMLIVAL